MRPVDRPLDQSGRSRPGTRGFDQGKAFSSLCARQVVGIHDVDLPTRGGCGPFSSRLAGWERRRRGAGGKGQAREWPAREGPPAEEISTKHVRADDRAGRCRPTRERDHGGSTPVAPTSVVDFWFDPISPWAWLTSRWLLDVQEVRPVKLVWHLLSMSVMGDGADVSEDVRAQLDAGWAPVRVASPWASSSVRSSSGPSSSSRHQDSCAEEGFGREVLEASLADVGCRLSSPSSAIRATMTMPYASHAARPSNRRL